MFYSGKDGRLLFTLAGERLGDAFGSTVAGFSSGQEHYLVVGAPRVGRRPSRARVYVYGEYAGQPKFVIDADATGECTRCDVRFGPGRHGLRTTSLSRTGPMPRKGAATGRIYLHSGRTGERLLTLTGEAAGDGFGTSKSTAGDVGRRRH